MALSHPLSSLSCCSPLRSGRGCQANSSGRREQANPITSLRLKEPHPRQRPHQRVQPLSRASVMRSRRQREKMICQSISSPRLIWQESRFDPTAVSRAGAQGVAQFMPATANARGLADPFDPIEAIAQSAKLLRDLRREFGNLGLAAAAYNEGPRRVRGWLAGRRGLPRETDAYVRIVTGQSPEQWARGQAGPAEAHVAHAVPCQQIAGLVARAPALEMKPLDPWGVQLVGSSSDATALVAYRRLQEKYAPILGGREPRVLHHGLA